MCAWHRASGKAGKPDVAAAPEPEFEAGAARAPLRSLAVDELRVVAFNCASGQDEKRKSGRGNPQNIPMDN